MCMLEIKMVDKMNIFLLFYNGIRNWIIIYMGILFDKIVIKIIVRL